MSAEYTRSRGIGYPGVLALLFVTLKLTGNIGWSWIWVLSPLWILPALFVVVFAVVLVLLITVDLYSDFARAVRRRW